MENCVYQFTIAACLSVSVSVSTGTGTGRRAGGVVRITYLCCVEVVIGGGDGDCLVCRLEHGKVHPKYHLKDQSIIED